MDGLTDHLTQALTAAMDAPLPDPAAAAARRTLLNVVGTTVGASRKPAVDLVLAYAATHGGEPTTPVLGRRNRTDGLHAALAMGTAAHLDDFDDTHLETVIHPGGAPLAAMVAATAEDGSSGDAAFKAFALGCEAQLRVGAAMSPSHYDGGWHITGTCGVLGAAVTAGLLTGLSPVELRHALAIAASQTLGLRDAFGTMTKAFHVGKGAANGVLAAKLAATGFTGAADVLEHQQGYFRALADDLDPGRITRGWDADWELERNTFKPYPCGIVIHPIIDAAIALHDEITDVDDIEEVVIRCHPLVVELTGNPEPVDGLAARFSAVHGAAAGLVDGTVGLAQFEDERVRAGDLVALRARTRLRPDTGMQRDAALVELHRGPSAIWHFIEHARGSLARPLTDDELQSKVAALVEPVLPGASDDIVRAVDGLAEAPDVTGLVTAATATAA